MSKDQDEDSIAEYLKAEQFLLTHYDKYKEKYEKIKDYPVICVVDKHDPVGAYKCLTPVEYIYYRYREKEEKLAIKAAEGEEAKNAMCCTLF